MIYHEKHAKSNLTLPLKTQVAISPKIILKRSFSNQVTSMKKSCTSNDVLNPLDDMFVKF